MAIPRATKLIIAGFGVFVLAIISIPNLLLLRMHKIEDSNRRFLVGLYQFQSEYFKEHGEYSCQKNPTDGSMEKNVGPYILRFEECSKSQYVVSAMPNHPGTSGPMAFCIDQTGTMKWFRAGETCVKDGRVWNENQ